MFVLTLRLNQPYGQGIKDIYVNRFFVINDINLNKVHYLKLDLKNITIGKFTIKKYMNVRTNRFLLSIAANNIIIEANSPIKYGLIINKKSILRHLAVLSS